MTEDSGQSLQPQDSSERWQEELSAEIENYVTTLAERTHHTLSEFIAGMCQSPIERLLAARMFARYHQWLGVPECIGKAQATAAWAAGVAGNERITIFPQVAVGPYRADFFVVAKFCVVHHQDAQMHMICMAIECDGHEFHNATKQQIEHDRKRDRFFQRHGIVVFRFPGSEIFRDPDKCADEVWQFIEDRVESALEIGASS